MIFTNQRGTLEQLQILLTREGFQFCMLSGDMTLKQRTKAFLEFDADPTKTVFLLTMRSSACGITLTQANHIFVRILCCCFFALAPLFYCRVCD